MPGRRAKVHKPAIHFAKDAGIQLPESSYGPDHICAYDGFSHPKIRSSRVLGVRTQAEVGKFGERNTLCVNVKDGILPLREIRHLPSRSAHGHAYLGAAYQ